ncbi:FAD-dependent tricarballylate dehydrogenase TcuA [Psychrobacillus sp. FSL K6-1464]|uniref:FAD-dependent tricarballylate dehydrogenase TcuA n=1 Tax=Psychrobacillus sp. FSL K6-1464 TaxID=2921545 RepID=UPI0030FCB191
MSQAWAADVVVVGAGNAAICAAIAAAEQGSEVIVLEISSEAEKGGNTTYTHGSMRFAYNNGEEVRALLPEMTDEEFSMTDFGDYTKEQFFDDVSRLSNYRTDYDLANILAKESYKVMQWLTSHQVKWIPIYGRQAFKIDGIFKFWGGMVLEAVGGGKGLVDALHQEAIRLGVRILYNTSGVKLDIANKRIQGIYIREQKQDAYIQCKSVVLASGGFHANVEMRTKYLGPGWDSVHTRGCKFNTGAGLKMAIDVGARTIGNWSGAHAVGGDRYLPNFKEGFQKLSYPFGILINKEGKRFIDEGEDFRNYTYAKIGKEILKQPGQYAWQVFDTKGKRFLREEYEGRAVSKVVANTLEELVELMGDVDHEGFLAEVENFNKAVMDVPFDPNMLDGKGTEGLRVPKSNWALPINEGPFVAYAIGCGITFTYGGLHITKKAQVLHEDTTPIEGLYAAGEIVGGIYYDNYPGGAGLTSGSVFGKIAGSQAAKYVQAEYQVK